LVPRKEGKLEVDPEDTHGETAAGSASRLFAKELERREQEVGGAVRCGPLAVNTRISPTCVRDVLLRK
jgi:hypothetical protein